MADSDCCVFMGSNMAENHPVAFRWPMKAKVEHGATLIHVDPRFTRTSAMCDIYAPIRAGSDIAFLGGLINYVIHSERWNQEPFFRTFLVHYTNAPMIVSDQFQDAEELGGVFSGLVQYTGGVKEWPYDGFVGEYETNSWQYAQTRMEPQGWRAATQRAASSVAGRSPSFQVPKKTSAPSAAAAACASRRFWAPYSSADTPGFPCSPRVRWRSTTRSPMRAARASTAPQVSSISPACAPMARIVRAVDKHGTKSRRAARNRMP